MVLIVFHYYFRCSFHSSRNTLQLLLLYSINLPQLLFVHMSVFTLTFQEHRQHLMISFPLFKVNKKPMNFLCINKKKIKVYNLPEVM